MVSIIRSNCEVCTVSECAEMALLKDQPDRRFGDGHHPDTQGDKEREGAFQRGIQGLVEFGDVLLSHKLGEEWV